MTDVNYIRTRITVWVFVLLHFACVKAQEYVYSVATGVSWAADIFPAIEQRDLNQGKGKAGLEGAPNFENMFQSIIQDYSTFNTYNDSIFFGLSHQEWINVFGRRAYTYSEIYSANNERIATLRDYFDDDNVPEASFDSLFFWTRHMYHRNFNDIFFYEQVLDILIPHYEALHDIEHLVFCYSCAGFVHYQISRMGEKAESQLSEQYYRKILDMSSYFARFTDPLNRYYFLSAVVNLTVMHTQDRNIELEDSYRIINRIRTLYQQPEVLKLLHDDKNLEGFAQWTIDIFRFRAITTYISHGLDDKQLRDKLYGEYTAVRQEMNNDLTHLVRRYYAKVEYDDILIEAFMGHLSWNKAYRTFENNLRIDPALNETEGVPSLRIVFLNNLFESQLFLIEHTTLTFKQKRASINETLSHMLNLLARYEHGQHPFEKGLVLAKLATNKQLLQYLDSDERRELLFRLVVLEQPITYVHASMVAALSRILAESLIENKPEYFIGIPDFNTIDDVRQRKDALIDYVYQSAIYHDMGKILMPSIINNCFRKLTPHEYQIIKLHPEMALPFFDIDPSLKRYIPVAIGHHKWYDGDGYPTAFRNRHSPYFPIINIITLCDCMDAATENIGRNYHKPKSFETIMQEFDDEAGTRYCPDLVKYIIKNTDVYNQMKHTVLDGRYDYYYILYMSYMNKNKEQASNRQPLSSYDSSAGIPKL